jgi:hypothetical protein
MDYVLPAVTAFHVLAAVFLAGTVFALVRTAGQSAEQLAHPQIGSGILAVLTGGYLWHLTHDGNFGTAEQVLGVGALYAILALLLLIATLPVVRRLRAAQLADQPPLRRKIVIRQRIAGALLVITIICMAITRYV